MKAVTILILAYVFVYWASISFKEKPVIIIEEEEEIYAGRFDTTDDRTYNDIGIPIHREWMTSAEWKGEHLQDKKQFKEWKEKYIRDFVSFMKKSAKEESVISGIPWQIYVSQAILESNYGKSKLAVQGNNLFGVKCWDKSIAHIVSKDDHDDDKFKVFHSYWWSIRNQSKLLNGKYRARIKGKPTLEKWVDCLCGGRTIEESKKFVESGGQVYATSCYKGKKSYAQKLLKIINRL